MPSLAPPDGNSVLDPLVSVVIPVYNRAPLIGRAISSVLAQTYQRFEIIVVDDASSDALAAALAGFADPRLRTIVHPINRGAAAARNTGIAASRGAFIAFLDSDDVWFPDKLAHQVAAMRSQPSEVAGHVCAYDCVKTGYPVRRIVPDWTALSFRRSMLFGCTCGPGSTLFCRREIFVDVGPFDEELRRLEDWDWLLRLATAGRLLLGSSSVLARVEVGSGAARSAVDAALQRIRAQHYATVTREGSVARRIFEASLLLESAAAAFGDKDFAPAISAIMRSIACYPLRGAGFYRRLAHYASKPLRLAGERRAAS